MPSQRSLLRFWASKQPALRIASTCEAPHTPQLAFPCVAISSVPVLPQRAFAQLAWPRCTCQQSSSRQLSSTLCPCSVSALVSVLAFSTGTALVSALVLVLAAIFSSLPSIQFSRAHVKETAFAQVAQRATSSVTQQPHSCRVCGKLLWRALLGVILSSLIQCSTCMNQPQPSAGASFHPAVEWTDTINALQERPQQPALVANLARLRRQAQRTQRLLRQGAISAPADSERQIAQVLGHAPPEDRAPPMFPCTEPGHRNRALHSHSQQELQRFASSADAKHRRRFSPVKSKPKPMPRSAKAKAKRKPAPRPRRAPPPQAEVGLPEDPIDVDDSKPTLSQQACPVTPDVFTATLIDRETQDSRLASSSSPTQQDDSTCSDTLPYHPASSSHGQGLSSNDDLPLTALSEAHGAQCITSDDDMIPLSQLAQVKRTHVSEASRGHASRQACLAPQLCLLCGARGGADRDALLL
eukprot:4619045-Amphidinium_carterae.1